MKIIISPPIKVIITRNISQYEWVFKNRIIDKIKDNIKISIRLNIGWLFFMISIMQIVANSFLIQKLVYGISTLGVLGLNSETTCNLWFTKSLFYKNYSSFYEIWDKCWFIFFCHGVDFGFLLFL